MATGTINERSVDGVVNLIPDDQHILNMTVDEARRRLLADDPAAATGTGCDAASALAVDGLSDVWIRSRRGRKIEPDPSLPIAHFREAERRLDGSCAVVLHVLLAGAECALLPAFSVISGAGPWTDRRRPARSLGSWRSRSAKRGRCRPRAASSSTTRAISSTRAPCRRAMTKLSRPCCNRSTGSPSNATRGWSGGAVWSSLTASPDGSRLRWAWRPPMRRPWHNSTRG